MQNQTHLCSSAAGNLPFQHSVQSIFTVFTIKLLHEKVEDNEFPCSAQQQRALLQTSNHWCCWSTQFRELLYCLIEASSFNLYKYGKNFVCTVSDMKAADEILAISLKSLWKCEPEEFYTWKNIKILIIILEINVSESGKGCGGARMSVANRPC